MNRSGAQDEYAVDAASAQHVHNRMPLMRRMHSHPILDLGKTPLADRLLATDELDQPEFFAPLK
jgi:hypothetical protein